MEFTESHFMGLELLGNRTGLTTKPRYWSASVFRMTLQVVAWGAPGVSWCTACLFHAIQNSLVKKKHQSRENWTHVKMENLKYRVSEMWPGNFMLMVMSWSSRPCQCSRQNWKIWRFFNHFPASSWDEVSDNQLGKTHLKIGPRLSYVWPSHVRVWRDTSHAQRFNRHCWSQAASRSNKFHWYLSELTQIRALG